MKPLRLDHGDHSHEISSSKLQGLSSQMRALMLMTLLSACNSPTTPKPPGPDPIKFDPSVCLEVASVNAGEAKVIEIDSATGPDADLLGNRVELNAGTLDQNATVCLQPATASNLPVPGEGTLKSAEGISVKFLRKDEEVDPDTGEENQIQPAGTYDLVLRGKRNTVVYHNPVSDTLDEESTEIELSGDTLESRATVSHASAFYPLNLDPKLSVVASQTGPNEVTFDFSGTEDEGSAMPNGLTKEVEGLTLTPTADPNKFKATVPEGSQTFTASVKDPDSAVDAKNVGVEVLGAPTISNIQIDCSSTIGLCASGGETYPMTFDLNNATSCMATVELVSGAGTAGSVTACGISGNQGTFNYISGSHAGSVVKITIQTNGLGGQDIKSYQFTLQ